MAAERRARGDAIEALACAHLQAAGLCRLAANASYRFGELDLVMRDTDGTVVFVEVRFRTSVPRSSMQPGGAGGFGGAALSVDRRKRRRLALAAQAWLKANRVPGDVPCRFDVVAAGGTPAAPRLEWLKDAFRVDDC